MERRELLGLMGIGAAGLLTTGAARGVEPRDEQDKHHDHHDPKHHEHLRIMVDCIEACNETAHHCLEHLASDKTEQRPYHARVHELTMDCQAICALTATLMARHSPSAKPMHQACAEVCATCAAECEKSQDEIKKACAEKCRACEKVCRACCEG